MGDKSLRFEDDNLDDSSDHDQSNVLEIISQNPVPVILSLVGLIFIGLGIIFSKQLFTRTDGIEVLETTSGGENELFVVEVGGAVESPGVYEMNRDSRVEEALKMAGGLTHDADTEWIEKVLNRAAKVKDGQKIYIPKIGESSSSGEQSNVLSANNSGGDQSVSSGNSAENQKLVNINDSSASELESLWGIGPVYAQNIIEHRPYSSVEELLDNGILKTNVYERNKDLMTVY